MTLIERYAEAAEAGARGDLPTEPPSVCREVDMAKHHVPKYRNGSRVGLSPPPAPWSPGSAGPYALSRAALDPRCQQLHRQVQLAGQALAVRDLTAMRLRSLLVAQQGDNALLRQQLAAAQHQHAVAACYAQQLEAALRMALVQLAMAGGDVAPILSAMEGNAVQQMQDEQQQQHQQQHQCLQAGCETPTRAAAEGWEQQWDEEEQEACATPRYAVFGIFDPFETPQKQQQQQQVETPTPCSVSLGRQQPVSCRLSFTLGVDGEQGTGVGGQGATEEVEVLSADGASGVAGGEVQQQAGELGVWAWGPDKQLQVVMEEDEEEEQEEEEEEEEEEASRWAEGSASLARVCPSAASPQGYSLFGTGAGAGMGRFGPHLLRTAAKLAAASKACPAAASRWGGSLLNMVAGANTVGPHSLGGLQPAAGSAASCTYGSGSGCGGLAAPGHCHLAHTAAHARADEHRHTGGGDSQLHVARQPGQEAASFATLRSPLHTPLGLRARLPATRSGCTPGGGSAMGRHCGGGGC